MSDVPAIPAAGEGDVLVTRMFAAPREVVWRFWTEADLLAEWFGPAGVRVDRGSVVVEAREGGRWELDMVVGEGQRAPIRTVLTAVRPPEYLEGVLVGEPVGGRPLEVVLRVWFHDHGDRTRMTLHQGPFDPQYLQPTRDGWTESFTKIDALVGA